jgi:tRNA-splicing ligase RtcB
MQINRINDYLWEIPRTGGMRVPGRVYANKQLIDAILKDDSLKQVQNVAHLPGIVKYSIAMPDIHQGYGFPIGGVCATDPAEEGVISPGGVGYDINCGVRLARTSIQEKDVQGKLHDLVRNLFYHVPSGVGSKSAIEKLSKEDLRNVMRKGARWVVEQGMGSRDHLDRTEEYGCLNSWEVLVPEIIFWNWISWMKFLSRTWQICLASSKATCVSSFTAVHADSVIRFARIICAQCKQQ